MSDDIVPDHRKQSTLQEAAKELEVPPVLTERQQRIIRYRMRGITQKAIAAIEGVSQPAIARDCRYIREKMEFEGTQINQDVVVGESLTLYKEVEYRAWDLYDTAKKTNNLGAAAKALRTVMDTQERSIKLLMEMGLVRRAAIEHQHTITPFLQKWADTTPQERHSVVQHVIDTQLTELPEPQPPEYDNLETTGNDDEYDDEYDELAE